MIDDIWVSNIAEGNEFVIFIQKERKWQLTIPPPKFVNATSGSAYGAVGAAVSPMPGVVDKVLVSPGDSVRKGDPLLVIVAMKMEVR